MKILRYWRTTFYNLSQPKLLRWVVKFYVFWEILHEVLSPVATFISDDLVLISPQTYIYKEKIWNLKPENFRTILDVILFQSWPWVEMQRELELGGDWKKVLHRIFNCFHRNHCHTKSSVTPKSQSIPIINGHKKAQIIQAFSLLYFPE